MATANVAIVRELFDAWNAGDVDRALQVLDPDVELRPLRAQLEGTDYRGHEGFRRVRADLFEDWDEVQQGAEEIRAAGDRVVVIGTLNATGKASGITVEVPIGWVFELRDGRIVFAQSFSEPADALRAAGLDE